MNVDKCFQSIRNTALVCSSKHRCKYALNKIYRKKIVCQTICVSISETHAYTHIWNKLRHTLRMNIDLDRYNTQSTVTLHSKFIFGWNVCRLSFSMHALVVYVLEAMWRRCVSTLLLFYLKFTVVRFVCMPSPWIKLLHFLIWQLRILQ